MSPAKVGATTDQFRPQTAAREVPPVDANAPIGKGYDPMAQEPINPEYPWNNPDQAVVEGMRSDLAPDPYEFQMRPKGDSGITSADPRFGPAAERPPTPEPAPFEHPIQQLHLDEQGILSGIFREGKGAAGSAKNMNLAIQNAPYLLEAVPELRGTAPGAMFDGKLFNGFQRIGHELKAMEASIPDETPVVTSDAVAKLEALQHEAAASLQNDAVRSIEKVKARLEEKPTIQWKDFIQAKRAFDAEVGVDTATGSKIYQVFKDMSNSVKPELGVLNQKYYTTRIAMDLAKMNLYKGLRLSEVAAKAKGLRA